MFLSLLVSFIFISCCYVSSVKAALSFDFYAASCPNAELMIRNTVSRASSNDPSVPGKLLRLVFHDCFVEVSHQHQIDYSVRLFEITYENNFLLVHKKNSVYFQFIFHKLCMIACL